MRLIFGTLSLLIVLAIIGVVGKKQLQALGLSSGAPTVTVPERAPGATAAPADTSLPAKSRAIQHNVRDAAAAALQQGAERSASSP